MARRIEMTDTQWGEWTVLRPAGTNSAGTWHWECLCSCGAVKPVEGAKLRSGLSTCCRTCSNVKVRAKKDSKS